MHLNSSSPTTLTCRQCDMEAQLSSMQHLLMLAQSKLQILSMDDDASGGDGAVDDYDALRHRQLQLEEEICCVRQQQQSLVDKVMKATTVISPASTALLSSSSKVKVSKQIIPATDADLVHAQRLKLTAVLRSVQQSLLHTRRQLQLPEGLPPGFFGICAMSNQLKFPGVNNVNTKFALLLRFAGLGICG